MSSRNLVLAVILSCFATASFAANNTTPAKTNQVTPAGKAAAQVKLPTDPNAPTCPAGWTGKPATNYGEIVCTPIKPATKIKCPPKTQYYETACEIGCKEIIY